MFFHIYNQISWYSQVGTPQMDLQQFMMLTLYQSVIQIGTLEIIAFRRIDSFKETIFYLYF